MVPVNGLCNRVSATGKRGRGAPKRNLSPHCAQAEINKEAKGRFSGTIVNEVETANNNCVSGAVQQKLGPCLCLKAHRLRKYTAPRQMSLLHCPPVDRVDRHHSRWQVCSETANPPPVDSVSGLSLITPGFGNGLDISTAQF